MINIRIFIWQQGQNFVSVTYICVSVGKKSTRVSSAHRPPTNTEGNCSTHVFESPLATRGVYCETHTRLRGIYDTHIAVHGIYETYTVANVLMQTPVPQ